MAVASFEKEWKSIKTKFEQATKKKKPSEKFLGIFNKASGLTPATVAFDKALATHNLQPIETALKALRKTAGEYRTTLDKAAKAEKDDAALLLMKIMDKDIDDLLAAAATQAVEACRIARCANLAAFIALIQSKGTGERVREYMKKTHNEDMLAFLLTMAKRDYSNKTYQTFFAPNAKFELNLSSNLSGQFDPNNLGQAPWEQVTKEMLEQVHLNVVQQLNAQNEASLR